MAHGLAYFDWLRAISVVYFENTVLREKARFTILSDDYQQAREKLELAEYTSNIDAAKEDKSLERPKLKRK